MIEYLSYPIDLAHFLFPQEFVKIPSKLNPLSFKKYFNPSSVHLVQSIGTSCTLIKKGVITKK